MSNNTFTIGGITIGNDFWTFKKIIIAALFVFVIVIPAIVELARDLLWGLGKLLFGILWYLVSFPFHHWLFFIDCNWHCTVFLENYEGGDICTCRA